MHPPLEPPPEATLGPILRSALTGPVAVTIEDRRGVCGAGLDLVDVDRLQLAVDRSGPALARRLFDPDEREACGDGRDRHLTAGLFGIKESVVKILGGLSPGQRYADMSVAGIAEQAAGAPLPVRLRGALAGWSEDRRVELIGGAAPMCDGVTLSWAFALRLEPSC